MYLKYWYWKDIEKCNKAGEKKVAINENNRSVEIFSAHDFQAPIMIFLEVAS